MAIKHLMMYKRDENITHRRIYFDIAYIDAKFKCTYVSTHLIRYCYHFKQTQRVLCNIIIDRSLDLCTDYGWMYICIRTHPPTITL